MEFLYSFFATIIVSFISLIGVFVLLKTISKNNLIITALVSFAAGTLIGDVFLHLLPEQIEKNNGYSIELSLGIVIGIVVMLLLESYLHCSHDSNDAIDFKNHTENHKLGVLNLIADGVHNFLDGIAIAVSFLTSPTAGVASTVAIILHEIPQELSDASILIYSGWNKKKILFFNFLTALTAVFGAITVFVLSSFIENLENILLPIAIGQFLYIALADLLPVIHKKTGWRKYFVEISLFLLGVLIMYTLTFLE